MARLAFNLFDELENFDPRVEHFVQSRQEAARRKNSALKTVANRDDNNANVSDMNDFRNLLVEVAQGQVCQRGVFCHRWMCS